MAHFYGTLDGSAKTVATRCGTKNSGLKTHCASWSGCVRCDAWVKDGVDHIMVRLIPWEGHGVYLTLYDGPIGGPPPDEAEESEESECDGLRQGKLRLN